jgi:hypothetical protein
VLCVAFLLPTAAAQIGGRTQRSFDQAFRDVTVKEGVQFDNIVAPSDFTMLLGAGAAFADYDGDGWLDLFVAQRVGDNALFRNLGDAGGFVDVAAQAGVAGSAFDATGALWGDYDNDGDPDLYLLCRGANHMARNDGSDGQGGWVFTDVTALTGTAGFGRTSSAVFADYDNDGFLDLYVGNHSYSMAPPAPGDPFHSDVLYHNVAGAGGERVFADVTASTLDPVMLAIDLAHSVGFFDYDNDNDLDLYVVNEDMNNFDPVLMGHNRLWRNDGSDGSGGWLFTEVAGSAGVDIRRHPMGLAIGDVNNDGWWDFSMSDLGANSLLLNQGGTFQEVATAAGVDRPTVPDGSTQVSWGLVFLDYDLDGFEDLYVGAGALNAGLTNQPNPLFHHDGDLSNVTFTKVPPHQSGAYLFKRTRGVIKGDYDRDGDEDLYVISIHQDNRLLRNEQQGGDFLAVRLIGTTSNRDAIGARVTASTVGHPTQYRLRQSGSTTGGSHDPLLYFGCSGLTTIDTITVDWPSGQQTVVQNVTVNQLLTLVE